MAVLIVEQTAQNQSEGRAQGQAREQPPMHDELVHYLEQHPAYYAIMKSNICILLLGSLSSKAKNALMLKREFPRMEQQDLAELIGMLEEIGVISHLDTGSNRFYYTNKQGKAFLAVYRVTKERYLGKEGGEDLF